MDAVLCDSLLTSQAVSVCSKGNKVLRINDPMQLMNRKS